MPSKEAMDAACKYIGLIHDVDSFGEYQGTVVLGDEPPYFLGCDYTSQGLAEAGHQTTIEYLALILNHHTAPLRAEVEALRVERDKYHEQVKMFQGAVLELLMGAEPDFQNETFSVPFEDWDYLMSADQNARDPNQKEIII